jgi:phosphoglycerol transferase MdoB-like AlkP superfamily enzyme
MSGRPQWLALFHPDLTWPLILIIGYLLLVAIGNLLAAYNNLVTQANVMVAAVNLISMLLYALPAYGLAKLKRWARFAELTLSIMSVLLGIVLMIQGILGMGVLVIVPHGLIAIYLLSDNCRRVFGIIT